MTVRSAEEISPSRIVMVWSRGALAMDVRRRRPPSRTPDSRMRRIVELG